MAASFVLFAALCHPTPCIHTLPFLIPRETGAENKLGTRFFTSLAPKHEAKHPFLVKSKRQATLRALVGHLPHPGVRSKVSGLRYIDISPSTLERAKEKRSVGVYFGGLIWGAMLERNGCPSLQSLAILWNLEPLGILAFMDSYQKRESGSTWRLQGYVHCKKFQEHL